jgi:Mrp family chromosome partitioning ATPase
MKPFPNNLSPAFAAAKAKAAPQWIVPEPQSSAAPDPAIVTAPAELNTSRKDGFVFISDPRGEAAKRYRAIAAAMVAGSWPRKRILVTSPGPGDGKTMTCVNLALALSERGQSVFLAELNLVRPRYRFVFGSPSAAGVEAALKGRVAPADVTFQLGDTRIAVASVATPMAGYELLRQESSLRALLAHGQENYQWTILDLPSIGESPAVEGLAAESGPVVMVARSRKTKPDAFLRASAALGGRFDYALLNDASW